MASEYKAHNVFLSEIDFEVLILEIPESEVDDRLTQLTSERGQISKSFYEDFIIASCIANINQLLYHINQRISSQQVDLMKIREELVNSIYGVNPLLDPKNLVINNNYVVKVKKTKTRRLKKDERWLVDNKNWDASYYDGLINQHNKDNKNDETNVSSDKDRQDSETSKGSNVPLSGSVKDLNSLEYEVVKIWWKRIGRYVEIKKFKEEDAESILKQRFFHNRTSFGTYIVSVCIKDFEDLFQFLDNLGIPQRVAPPILMNELYQLCQEVNGFLTFENAQEMAEEEFSDDDDSEANDPVRKKTTSQSSMGQYLKKKPKRKFRDIPKEDLLKLSDNMKIFLIGQDKAIDDVTSAIQRASVGLKDPYRPIGSFLFAGRTGVGKTLATKVLADELIKGRDNMVVVDCSEYTADHEYSKLIGAPSGYVGYESGGFLTNAVIKNPFTVIVFDEIEKASNKVHDLLLQILEEGRLTDGKGKIANFRESIIIMTSNIGVNEIDDIKKTIGFGNVAKVTEGKKSKALDKALKNKFRPEFLNRIDSVVHFRSLSKKDYMRIIDIELYKLNDNLKANDTEFKNLTLKFDERIRRFIYKVGIDEEKGARPLRRAIEKHIATPLAKKLLEDETKDDSIITVSAYRGKVKLDIWPRTEEIPFYMTDYYGNEEDLDTNIKSKQSGQSE
jgi:ATP-dependent Clp protease ATP-binding subunit ClpA